MTEQELLAKLAGVEALFAGTTASASPDGSRSAMAASTRCCSALS